MHKQHKQIAEHNTATYQLYCKHCGALLATIDDNGFTICRGAMRATVIGKFQMSMDCYRCRKHNALQCESTVLVTELAA